jgi:hypothetical protein
VFERDQPFRSTGNHLAGGIYLRNEDSRLIAMEEVSYDSESRLQKLLENEKKTSLFV